MKRLTTDTPDGNFETMLNFVYGKDGWAYIRHGGEHKDMMLTDWANQQCTHDRCDEATEQDGPADIDLRLCDCMMEDPICPIAMAYCFASQAVHLRSRLKMYEDILFNEDGSEHRALDDLRELVSPNDPLTQQEVRDMRGKPIWVESIGDPRKSSWEICTPGLYDFGLYGITWFAYRRKPEGG